jgi:cytochrome P450
MKHAYPPHLSTLSMATTIPGSMGLPYLGETFPSLSDPLTFFAQRHQRYGPICKTRVLGKTSVVLFGAQAQRQVLLASGDEPPYLTRDTYGFLEPIVGTSLVQMDGLPHQTQRKLVTPAFHAHNYADYLARINRAYDQVVGSWPEQGSRTFYAESQAIAFRVSTSLMLGIEESSELADMRALLHKLFDGALVLVPLNLPFLTYGKALAAKSLIDERLRAALVQHRETPTTDVLSLLLQARDEEGQSLSDDHLLATLKFLLFAGYETTTAVLSWGLLELLRNPDVYERLRTEIGVGTVGGEEPVGVEDLRKMPFLDAVIKETLRLHPAVSFLLRGVATPFEFEGYTIPAGWQVILPLCYTHRTAEYFADPERFDPARFLAPHEEDKKTPYAWMGFGGGKHSCLGMGIAQIEIKTVLTRLLRQFDLQLDAHQDLSAVYVPVKRPKGGAKISFHRHAAHTPALAV